MSELLSQLILFSFFTSILLWLNYKVFLKDEDRPRELRWKALSLVLPLLLGYFSTMTLTDPTSVINCCHSDGSGWFYLILGIMGILITVGFVGAFVFGSLAFVRSRLAGWRNDFGQLPPVQHVHARRRGTAQLSPTAQEQIARLVQTELPQRPTIQPSPSSRRRTSRRGRKSSDGKWTFVKSD